jgi:hypothetical protein
MFGSGQKPHLNFFLLYEIEINDQFFNLKFYEVKKNLENETIKRKENFLLKSFPKFFFPNELIMQSVLQFIIFRTRIFT